MTKKEFLTLMRKFVTEHINEENLYDKKVIVKVGEYLSFGAKIDLKDRTFGVDFKQKGSQDILWSYVFMCTDTSLSLYERQPVTATDMELFHRLTKVMLIFLEKNLEDKGLTVTDNHHITHDYVK